MRFLKRDKKHKMYQDSGMFENFDPAAAGQAGLAAGLDFADKKRQQNYYEGLAAQAQGKYADAKSLYMNTLNDLKSDKYDREEMTVNQAAADARDDAIAASKQFVDDAREKGEQNTASVLSILDGGDPAQAALAISQLDDISGSVSDEKQKALSMANQANAVYGAEAAKIDQYNVGVRDANRSRLAALANLELQRGASDMATQEQQGLQAEMTAAGMTPASDAFGTGISTYQAYAPQTAEDGMKFNAIEDFVGEEGGVSSSTTSGEEFSHKRNPIHMIDKDGEKVGEMTGGEYILNPKHSGDIKKLVDKGDAYGLLDYLDNLLSQPRFQ
jgi:hypothetical protein